MDKKYVANKVLLVNEEGKILLMRDAGVGDHANSKGTWDVPGGRMEKGETPMQALKREVFEEAGIEFDPTLARPVHIDIWGVGGDVENEPIIGIFYKVSVSGSSVRLSDEHSEVLWFDPALPLPEGVKESVAAAITAYQTMH